MDVRRQRYLHNHRGYIMDANIPNDVGNRANLLNPYNIYLYIFVRALLLYYEISFLLYLIKTVPSLHTIIQNVSNSVTFTAAAVSAILNSLLDFIVLSGMTCFEYIRERFSVAIILFLISLLVVVGCACRIFRMKDRLEIQITSLRLDIMKQQSDLKVKQEFIRKLTIELEEKDKLNSALTKNKSKLQSQASKLKLKVQEEVKGTVLLQVDKLKLTSQLEKLKLKARTLLEEKEGLQKEKAQLKTKQEELRLKLKEANECIITSKTMISEMKSQNQKISLELEKEKDKGLCIVCADNHKNILLIPCSHFCLCKKCLGHKKWSECPVCRQVIQSTIDVYD